MNDSGKVEPPAAHAEGQNLRGSLLADRLIVLLSHERSGSHYVADLLRSTGALTSVDEVCNFNAVDPAKSKYSYYRFRYEHAVQDTDFALHPDGARLDAFLDRYFELLLSAGHSKQVLVDIKYGHVHNFEIGWWPSEQRPFLAKYLEKRHIRVVHLSRRDSLAATLSSYIAEHTGIWHRREGDGAGKKIRKLKAPAQKIVHDALALEREKDNFFSWLATNRCVHVTYEECTGDVSGPATLAAICRFLDLPEAELVSAHRKVTPALKDVIDNCEELRRTAALFGQGRLLPQLLK